MMMMMYGDVLQLSLDLHYTEDEIYELSLAREPRNSLSSVSSHKPLTIRVTFVLQAATAAEEVGYTVLFVLPYFCATQC